MKRILPLAVLAALLPLLHAGCGGSETEKAIRDAVTLPEQDLAGTYVLFMFQTDYFDSGYNYIGSLTQNDYAAWFGQLQLGNGGDLYQAGRLDDWTFQTAGVYTVTYTSGTVEGALNVMVDGVPDIWDFVISDDTILTTTYGYDSSSGWYYIDYNFWQKTSDRPTAF